MKLIGVEFFSFRECIYDCVHPIEILLFAFKSNVFVNTFNLHENMPEIYCYSNFQTKHAKSVHNLFEINFYFFFFCRRKVNRLFFFFKFLYHVSFDIQVIAAFRSENVQSN